MYINEYILYVTVFMVFVVVIDLCMIRAKVRKIEDAIISDEKFLVETRDVLIMFGSEINEIKKGIKK